MIAIITSVFAQGVLKEINLDKCPIYKNASEGEKSILEKPIVRRGMRITKNGNKLQCERIASNTIGFLKTTTPDSSPDELSISVEHQGARVRKGGIVTDGTSTHKNIAEAIEYGSDEMLLVDGQLVPSNTENFECKYNGTAFVHAGTVISDMANYWEGKSDIDLSQYIAGSGAIYEMELIKNREPQIWFTPFHLKQLYSCNAPFAEEMEDKKKRILKAMDPSEPNFYVSKIRLCSILGIDYLPLEELMKTVVQVLNACMETLKDGLIDYVYEYIANRGADVSREEKLKRLSQHGKVKDVRPIVPRLFIEPTIGAAAAIASWTNPEYVYSDGSLKIDFPFEIYDRRVAEAAAKYFASALVFSRAPIPLCYAGVLYKEKEE